MNKILRIGILMEEICAWQYEAIKKILATQQAECTLIVEFSDLEDASQEDAMALFGLFSRVDKKIFQGENDPFEIKDLYQLIPDAAYMQVDGAEISPRGQEQIRAMELDIFISFRKFPLKGPVLDLAKYGVWSYFFGSNQLEKVAPIGFWAYMQTKPVITSGLIRLAENPADNLTLFQSWSRAGELSISRAQYSVVWKSSTFLARAIRLLATEGEARFFDNLQTRFESPPAETETIEPPSLMYSAKILASHTAGVVSTGFQKLVSRGQWALLFQIGDPQNRNFYDFKVILPPKDRFWADPFILYRDGSYFIFLEELLYEDSIGFISVMKMDEKGNYSMPKPIIKKEYHLSYPFLFEYEGELYMIPESCANHTIELYKCAEFPMEWTYVGNLMEGVDAVDTTLFFYENKWWMFTSMAKQSGAIHDDELFLFYADSPLSDAWTPHPKNPIVSDVRNARPAGRIFWENGKWIRPAQNCAPEYGYGFAFNEILSLSETDYEEAQIFELKPNKNWGVKRTHTYNAENSLTFIDGYFFRSKLF